jgi:hypothetical protein
MTESRSDACVAEVEEIERDGNQEHRRGSGDDRLGAVEAHHQAQGAIGQDRFEPDCGLAEKAHLRALVVPLRFFGALHGLGWSDRADPQDDGRRPDEGRGVEDVDGGDVGNGEEQASERRACEEADALDRARRDVGRCQLSGVARKLRK